MRSLANSPHSFLLYGAVIGVFLGLNLRSLVELTLPKESQPKVRPDQRSPLAVCPPAEECICSDTQLNDSSQLQFDETALAAAISSPKQAVIFFNKLCSAVTKSSTSAQGRKLGVGTILFCYKHILTYKRNYDYEWDNVQSSEMGYYQGTDLPPYQMDWFQYSAIHAAIASIPAKPIKDDIEKLGKSFADISSNYNQWNVLEDTPRGAAGPRVLFWGCGADTPMHALLVKFLGGSITFIDNSATFIDECKKVSRTL